LRKRKERRGSGREGEGRKASRISPGEPNVKDKKATPWARTF